MKRKLRRTFTSLVAVVIMISMIMSSAAFVVTAEDARHMYNLYLNPDLSAIKGGTQGKIRTYSISFCANDANPAPGTYWALANFNFTNLDSKGNSNKQTYGGYAGFQVLGSDRGKDHVAILSIFQHDHTKTDGTCATCMVKQKSEAVGPAKNEPACVHSINPFTWEGNKRYRMVLHCWDDIQTGNTFIGMWIQDIASRQWTLYSYYDTKLKNSVMTGDMHFFLENFAAIDANNTRKYKINDIYAKDASDDSWKSITSATQSYWGSYAMGYPSFGRDNYYSYFWGNVTPQNTDPKLNPFAQTKTSTITQPSTPRFGDQKAYTITKCQKYGTSLNISWEPDATSTPQLSYELRVYNKAGECVRTIKQTRPDAISCTINNFYLDEYNCALTVTDIFGRSITKLCGTQNCPESITITNNPTPNTYSLGDILNTNGLTFDVKYRNGKIVKGVKNGYTVLGFDSKTVGTKTLTVIYGGATATYNVEVKEPSVTITKKVSELFIGDTSYLGAVTEPANSTVEWSSSNPSVATVDKYNGKLTAVKAGKATITASSTFNNRMTYKSSFDVTVKTPAISWNFKAKNNDYSTATMVKPGERIILATKFNVPGNYAVWYEVEEDDKHLGKIVCDTKYYYFEAYEKTGRATIKAKFKYNGNFYYTSPIDITISNRI